MPSETPMKRLHICIPDPLYTRYLAQARTNGISISEQLRIGLAAYAEAALPTIKTED